MRRRQMLIPIAVFAADRISKLLSVRIPAGGSMLIPGVLGLRYTENTGMAFSMMSGKGWLLGVISLIFSAALVLLLAKKQFAPFPETGLLLMLGGAAGNMVDRFAAGSVPDMIEFLFLDFAVFNIADVCLTAGCAIVAVSLLFRRKDWEHE